MTIYFITNNTRFILIFHYISYIIKKLEKFLSSFACSNPKAKYNGKTIKLNDTSKTISNDEFKTLKMNNEKKNK